MERLPESPEAPKQLDEPRMSLLEHLQELRVRLRNAVLVLMLAGIGASFFANDFFVFLARPVMQALQELGQPPTMIRISPTEGFWVQFKLSIVLGLAVALPLIFWELWKFVAPGLYRREKKLALAVTGATVACFIGGAAFGYTLLSKTTHLFLLATRPPDNAYYPIANMLTTENVVNFQITMLLGCGVAFELPVVLGLLGWLGLVSARGLWRFNKYALVLAAVAAAVITPGSDPYSQLLLAGPLYALYNISIPIVWLIEKRHRSAAGVDSPLLLVMAAAWPVLRRPLTPIDAALARTPRAMTTAR
jgi:sec-independent protein translocase protein TatC